MSRIKVYNWPNSCEKSNSFEITSLIPEWILDVRFNKCRVCFHFNSNQTNWRIVDKIFSNQLVLSSMNVVKFCSSFQVAVIHRRICTLVPSFLVIFIVENNEANVKKTINGFKTNVLVLANQVEFRTGSELSYPFLFGYGESEVERKSTANLLYNMKPSGLCSKFILLVKKFEEGAPRISLKDPP